MPELYKNKYRIKSRRLKEYNYAQDGLYFVTICTKDRQDFFGKIINEKMILNQLGEMADKYWKEISEHFRFVKLDEYTIMPNHIHGIIVIDNDENFGGGVVHHGGGVVSHGRNAINTNTNIINANTNAIKTNTKKGGITGKHNPMGKNTLGEIIHWFKGRYKFESKSITPNFAWQSRFYDHIIRKEKSLDRIRQYIINNPMNWNLDWNNLEK